MQSPCQNRQGYTSFGSRSHKLAHSPRLGAFGATRRPDSCVEPVRSSSGRGLAAVIEVALPEPQLLLDNKQVLWTGKGQVTIPVEIRRLLEVSPGDQVLFRVAGGTVELQPVSMTLEDTFGVVPPLKRPEDFAALRETAIEEHAQKAVENMKE